MSLEEVRQAFLSGLYLTLIISMAATGIALVLGFLGAFARISGQRWVRLLAAGYVEVFRNTPLLIQLFFYYRGLQSIGVVLSPELCGILALGLYTGAYMTEVIRAGISALPREQFDAGLTLGLSRFRVYSMILLPQALRIVMPAIGNQLVSLTKNSSLVAFITVQDVFYVVFKGAVDEFRPLEYFLIGASIYVVICLGIGGITQGLEWLINNHKLRFPVLLKPGGAHYA